MKFINYLFVTFSLLVSGVVFSACGDDEPEKVAQVNVPAGTSTNIVLGYQDSMDVNAVVFNSSGDWSAEIYPANSSFEIVDTRSFSHVDWLEISPYQGGVGEIHCTLFAKPNHTYSARYAVIKVNSPTNYVVFHVTQNGMVKPGDTDKPVNPGDKTE